MHCDIAAITCVGLFWLSTVYAQDNQPTPPPSGNFLVPINLSTTWAVSTVDKLDPPCSDDVHNCLNKLITDCKKDNVHDYMACMCTKRQAGELACLGGVTPECNVETAALAIDYCQAAAYFELTPYVPPVAQSTSFKKEVQTLKSVLGGSDNQTETSTQKSTSTQPPSSTTSEKSTTGSASSTVSSPGFVDSDVDDLKIQGTSSGSKVLVLAWTIFSAVFCNFMYFM